MTVKHRLGSYEIVFRDLANALASEDNAYFITDKNVFQHWGQLAGQKPCLVVEPGECSKSLAVYDRCLNWLADEKAARSSTLIALGGGVVGDLAGFVAATYMRGIRLVQAPTSLLAMVDSSVGGKVGIDLEQGKNLVGAFYPPARVVLDLNTLSTLPAGEFTNGTAEIWKYAAIADWQLFQSLEAAPLEPDDNRLAEIVIHCVDLKRQVVEADELETTGKRAVLNFGHTVGHAIERRSGYRIRHGEAVSIGMVVEACIGERLGLTPAGLRERLQAGLAAQGLPTQPEPSDPATLVESMRLDKKGSNGRLAFALLDDFGSCKLVHDVPESVVLECLREDT